METMKEILIDKSEMIARNHGYDFLYEHVHGELLCQIILRDFEGSIIGTPLSFHLNLNEDTGKGEAVFYHSQGEFKRIQIDLADDNTLLNVLLFIDERLNFNRR